MLGTRDDPEIQKALAWCTNGRPAWRRRARVYNEARIDSASWSSTPRFSDILKNYQTANRR